MPTDITNSSSLYPSQGANTDWLGADRSRMQHGLYRNFGKRVIDVVLALLMLPILAPVIGVLWALVKRDGGPGFYAQKRIGKDGNAFHCWKLRSMVPNADVELRNYLAANPEAREQWENFHKLTDDPRITRVGRFIRKTSLDELPQIWNVLIGDMSFVGPRPVVRTKVRQYGDYRHTYKSVRPGITGLWQVSARNDVSFDDRGAYDETYVSNMSLAMDLKLIVKTALVVVKPTGV